MRNLIQDLATAMSVLAAASTFGRWTGAVAATKVINSASYSVKCDGATDDSVGLQNFLNAVGPNESGVIQPGLCVFKSTLTFPSVYSNISGAGQYATTLLYEGASTTNDLVDVFGTSATAVSGPATITDLRILSNTTMTDGTAIHVKWVGRLVLRNLVASGQNGNSNLWNGFWFDTIDMVRLDGYESQAQNDAIRVSAGGAGNPGVQYDLFINGGKIGASGVGVHIGGGFDNFNIDNSEVTSNKVNVLIDHTITPYKNQEVNFGPHFVTDQAQTGDDYLIDDNLANRTNYCTITISGPVTHSNTGNGVHVKNWPNCFLIVSSPYIISNAQNGILIDDASTVLSVSPSTVISGNTQYGINESFASTAVLSAGASFGNNSGQYSSNVGGTTSSPTQISTTRNFETSAVASVAAAGTTSSTATPLSAQYNYIGTVSAGQGVRLPPLINTEILTSNTGGGPSLLVYPPTGAHYGAAGANSPAGVAQGTTLRVVCTSNTQCWIN